jgi:LDH2 family malate/lactate/ureidoglycolate dehydrogenase
MLTYLLYEYKSIYMTSDETCVRVPDKNIRKFAYEVLSAAGVVDKVASATARGLWKASIRGVDSHGIRLLPHYLSELEGGRINPTPEFSFDRTTESTGRFDADHTYGIAAGEHAMEHAIDIAKETGVGHVSVRNSSHCGSMAYFGLMAAKQDMIGHATTHGTANTKTPRSNRPFFGNNPTCVTAPMRDEDPFCFDAAMTPISFNKVKQHRNTGKPLPKGAAANEAGEQTTDPHDATQLQYIGDYKGFGLAMSNDILNGLLSGMPVGQDISSMFDDPLSKRRRLGHYFCAIRIDAFVDTDEFKSRLQQLAEMVRDEPRADEEVPVQVPGDPEKKAKRERIQRGVPIPEHNLEQFDEISEELSVTTIRELD